jgi:hypothetical protein
VSWAILHRQRIARVLLVAAVCFGATKVWPGVPREHDLRIDLGPQHHEIMELQLEVRRDGQDLQGASFRFPSGAPQSVDHHLTLPTGRYDVELKCRRASGTTSVERVIDLSTEGVVRVSAIGDRV